MIRKEEVRQASWGQSGLLEEERWSCQPDVEDTGSARWRRGSATWQKVDKYKWVNLCYKS